jgi:hypothetical protein
MELNFFIDFLGWFNKTVMLPASNIVCLLLNRIFHVGNKLLLMNDVLRNHWDSILSLEKVSVKSSSPFASFSSVISDAKLNKNNCQESSSNVHTIFENLIESNVLLSSFFLSLLNLFFSQNFLLINNLLSFFMFFLFYE